MWALLYLHNWDPTGRVYPEIHGIYPDSYAAESARKAMSDPTRYWVRKCRLM